MIQKEKFSNWKLHKNRLQKTAQTFFKNKVKLRQTDVLSSEIHQQVFSKLDCLDCANCCSSIPPIVTPKDAQRISKHLNIGLGEFMVKYIVIDEDGDSVTNASPCPFLLEDNACRIYDNRPKACRKYPHTDYDFSKNIDLHIQNINYCPAVFKILEAMMRAVK